MIFKSLVNLKSILEIPENPWYRIEILSPAHVAEIYKFLILC